MATFTLYDRSMLRLAIFLLATFPLAAQTTPRIFLYSPWDSGQDSWLAISYDRAPVAKLKSGKFFAIRATPGRHILMAAKGASLTIDVPPGHDAYVRLGHTITLTELGEAILPVLTLEPPDEARRIVSQLVYLAPTKIVSPLVDQQDPTPQTPPTLQPRPPHFR